MEAWNEGNGGNELRTGTAQLGQNFGQWVDTQGNHSSNILFFGGLWFIEPYIMVHRLWFIVSP